MLKINQSGQTLIEALVAAVIVAVTLTAIVSGVTLSLRNSSFSRNQALATRYTQEAIESIRFFRDDAGWSSFHSFIGDGSSVVYCLNDLTSTDNFFMLSPGNCPNNDFVDDKGTFVREVLFESGNSSEPITVTVTTSWQEGDNTHQSTSKTILTNWSRS